MRTRSSRVCVLAAISAAATLTLALPTSQATAEFKPSPTARYSVLGASGASDTAVRAAIAASGGTVTSVNRAIGLYSVTAPSSGFVVDVSATAAVYGAAHQRPLGHAPTGLITRPSVEREHATDAEGVTSGSGTAAVHTDPLDDKLWGLRMVKADKARRVTAGSKKVLVGVLDTGVDASNPDIAPNFSFGLSRNFAQDITSVDGPCEVASCLDPVGTDDGGHGTHVAGTIGAAANGLGISGVAPDITLVELKGGQDSGFFFLEPAVNALTYAGDAGLDVVNMSFFVDPWLYNCQNNPADSPEQQAEQRTIVAAMSLALTYAHDHGVALVGALGNQHTDLGNPLPDTISPDFPPGNEYTRTIDNATCLSLPAEGPHVIGVSALGPSAKKADFSNYGLEQISLAAPGGWFRDGFGTDTFRTNGNLILSTYPRKVLQEQGTVDADGNVVPGAEGLVFKACSAAGSCGYYTYLQGTSMASPHVAGVAALVVSKFGHKQGKTGFGLMPDRTQRILERTAAEHACPSPPLQTYTNEGRPEEFNALCQGTTNFNGFYGDGIVDALAAVRFPHKH